MDSRYDSGEEISLAFAGKSGAGSNEPCMSIKLEALPQRPTVNRDVTGGGPGN
jgi:hypothetical protein